MANGWTGGQFSVIRVIVASYLLIEMGRWAAWQVDWPFNGTALVGSGFALMLLLGAHRVAGVVLWAIIVALAVELVHTGVFEHPSAGVLAIIASFSLPTMALLPTDPYGALQAKGRADPAGEWRYPPRLFAAQWVIVSVLYFVWAVLLLEDVGWRADTHGMRLGVFGREAPLAVSVAGNWLLLTAWLALAPLALSRKTRPIGWCAVLLVNVTVLPLAGHGQLAVALMVLHLFTFDPAWLPTRTAGGKDTVFYDGYCGLCHRWARFVLAEDVEGRCFELSPLQGEYLHTVVNETDRAALPDSIVLRRADGALWVKSRAVIAILDRLGGLWRVAAWLLRLVPRPLRDLAYDGVARVRLKLFAQPAEACPMVPAHLRGRFKH